MRPRPRRPVNPAIEQLDRARRRRSGSRSAWASSIAGSHPRGRGRAAPSRARALVARGGGVEGLGHEAPAYRPVGLGKANGPPEGGPFPTMFRRRPTLPPRRQGSTIGAGGLNFRVRDGTGCFPSAMATETLFPRSRAAERSVRVRAPSRPRNWIASASKGQVLGLLVPVGSTRCRAYTSGLSTWSSSRGLTWLTQWEISS